MLNMADVALRTVEIGALFAGVGSVAAFTWAFANEHARSKNRSRLQLPASLCELPELYWSFVALVTRRGHIAHLERAARRLDWLLHLSAAVRAADSPGRVTAAMYKTAVDYEHSVMQHLCKYFERSGVPMYDRHRRQMAPGADFEHAKRYGAFPIPYDMRCAHADIIDAVRAIVQDIHTYIPEKLREQAAQQLNEGRSWRHHAYAF